TAAPVTAAVSMNCLREMPFSLSFMTPPCAMVMIYLPGMAYICVAMISALLVQPAAQKGGPWKSLFDGKSLHAWRVFKTETAPKQCEAPGAKNCWEIRDSVLQKDGNANDLASKEQFGDFELELEWKIGEA